MTTTINDIDESSALAIRALYREMVLMEDGCTVAARDHGEESQEYREAAQWRTRWQS